MDGLLMAPSFLCPSNARDQLRAAWRAPCAPPFEEMWGGATSARGVTRGPTAASRCSTAIPHERHRGRRRPRRLSGHRTATKLMHVGRHWALKKAALGGEGPAHGKVARGCILRRRSGPAGREAESARAERRKSVLVPCSLLFVVCRTLRITCGPRRRGACVCLQAT